MSANHVNAKPRVFLVEDDPQALESTRKILELSGYEVEAATDGAQALERLRPTVDRASAGFDVILSDVRMPKLGGLEFLRALSLCGEHTPVVLMTAFGRVEDAVWAMKLGAVDFLIKPFKRQALLSALESAIKRARRREASSAQGSAPQQAPERRIIGESREVQSLRGLIRQVAPTSATVLIQGESGTGKELVASCLHELSGRTGRFIALNCAAIPEQLLESELFGFEKGAFTGATGAKEGIFEAANGGTLLLDEIGDMPQVLQAKLLRVLQESEVRRIGENSPRKIDVRVIAATHRDLRENVRLGTFRQDLMYRLEVITVQVPPLRDRTEDIPLLAAQFLASASRRHGKSIDKISPEAMDLLRAHTWPGNVRELSNVLERAVVFAPAPGPSEETEIRVADLPPHLATFAKQAAESARRSGFERPTIEVPLGTSLREVEDLLIRKTLEATEGDKDMTARLLGITSRTIYRKLGDKRPEEGKA